jgi:MFS family permease
VTNLKNRGIAFAFTSSPYMITAFAGSKAAEGFLENVSWRWGFGCFAIILPVVSSPIFFLLRLNVRKAKQEGVYIKERTESNILQRIWHVIVEFDGRKTSSNFFSSTEADFPVLQLLESSSLPVALRYSCCHSRSLILPRTVGQQAISLQ